MARAGDARPSAPSYRRAMESGTVRAAAIGDRDLWTRAFAVLYDPFLWVGERAGLRTLRRDLLEHAAGRTVELGSGTGLNLRHYPDGLDELILTEPVAPMRERLARRVANHESRARVLDAPAERLPLADETADTVVSTLVLCTVDDPEVALREIGRVLRPGGRLLFLEHVRAESPRLARWQDRLHDPWHRFAEGCHCNRPTLELIRASGLELQGVRKAKWRAMPRIVRPLVTGIAAKSGG
jgi:SAM-dependent methyltransferase